MAMIAEHSRCTICKELLGHDDYLITWGCAVDQTHPLWPYCDAPIHWRCYCDWEHRQEFAAANYELQLKTLRNNPYWVALRVESNWFAELMPRSATLRIHFRRTGTLLEFNPQNWPMATPTNEQEQQLLQADLEEARLSLGDWASLWAEFQPDAYQQAIQDQEAAQQEALQQQELADQERLRPYQESWQNMLAELNAGALFCPTCKRAHANIRVYNRSPKGAKSIFICQECGFSFGPEGLPEWQQR